MAETPANNINFMALMNPRFAAQQAAITQQQLMAQQLMADGGQQQPANEMASPGGFVVPQSPWIAAGKALEKGAGGYLSGKALGDQMAAYQGLHDQMAGSGAQGANGNAYAAMMNDPSFQMATALNPETGAKALADHLMQTSEQKNFADPAMHDLVQGEMQNKGLVNVNGHMQPANTLYPSAPASPISVGNPPIADNQPAASLDDLLNIKTGPSTEIIAAPVDIKREGPNVDWNNPAAVKGAEAEATKTGENIADTEKTFNVVSTQLPRALERFEQLRSAIPNSSYGEGLTPNPDGTPGWKTRWNNQFGDKKTVLANQAIEQIGAQGILPEIGPVIASTGGRGNQFMEKMASAASGIGLSLKNEAKLQAVQNVEDQYVGNMKAQAAILRENGRKAPTDTEIDAQVAQMKNRAVAIQHAREAIGLGAPKDKVMEKLKSMNIDAGNL